MYKGLVKVQASLSPVYFNNYDFVMGVGRGRLSSKCFQILMLFPSGPDSGQDPKKNGLGFKSNIFNKSTFSLSLINKSTFSQVKHTVVTEKESRDLVRLVRNQRTWVYVIVGEKERQERERNRTHI